MTTPGDATAALVNDLLAGGSEHLVLLMRHSAREFATGRHDLENPLTDRGRELATRMGARLDRKLLLRGYASPADRCVETARLILEGHAGEGGKVTRSRPAEALGPFYILDQMKMFRAMQAAGGQRQLLHRWYDGQVPVDIMMPSAMAANLIARFATAKLEETIEAPQLDVLVSHDMTLYTLRDQLLRQPPGGYGNIDFLEGMVFYEAKGDYYLRADQGSETRLDLTL